MRSEENRKTIRNIEKNLKKDYIRMLKVVKSNDLIQKAKYYLTMNEQKLINYVISMIKPTDEVFCKYTISASEFAELCGVSKDNIYRDFKKMIDSLDEKVFWVEQTDITYKFRWFSEAEYNKAEGTITVMLHSRIKQYLLQLKDNFTQYELWNVLSLKSKWSIRLYELFRSYNYQKRVVISVEELKKLLNAESYTNFYNFKVKVLEKAKADINEYTDIRFEYDIEKGGRGGKVETIIFTIEKKSVIDGLSAYRKSFNLLERKGDINNNNKTENN